VVYYGFAFAYWKQEKYDQALENADRAIELGDKLELDHPGLKAEAYNLKGSIYASQGKYDDAITNFKRALTDELYQTPEYASITSLPCTWKRKTSSWPMRPPR
jgi:tetratricopeptide (TPR) repeat protein